MIEMGKKYKKIAKGDLKLLTKYFLDGKNIYENWINIKPFIRQLENLGVQSNLLQDDKGNGKIYATIELKDPLDEFKKKVGVYTKADSTDVGGVKNENIQKKIEFTDNLSDVSISILDTKEEDREGLELEQFIEYEYIEGLKLLLQNDYKNILPNDFVKLRQLNEILYGKYIDLSNAYNETLYSLSSLNEEIRQQAKKYYEEYKLLKKDVYNGRIELKKQNEELQLEIKDNNKENSDIKEEMDKYITEKKKFKSLLGINEEEENKKEQKEENKENTDSNENDMLIKLLKNLSAQGYDVFKGANLTEEEMKLIEGTFDVNNMNEKVNENINPKDEKENNNTAKKEDDINNMNNNIINSEKKENIEMNPEENKNEREENTPENKNEENGEEFEEYDYDNEDIKENFELGNQVVTLIEKDVNDLYLKKIIEQIKIDQINAISYIFEKENDDNPHEITLKIENGELYCIDGTKFSAWLIKNFAAQ